MLHQVITAIDEQWVSDGAFKLMAQSWPRGSQKKNNNNNNLQKGLKNLANLEGKYSSGNPPSRVSRGMHC